MVFEEEKEEATLESEGTWALGLRLNRTDLRQAQDCVKRPSGLRSRRYLFPFFSIALLAHHHYCTLVIGSSMATSSRSHTVDLAI